MKYSLGMACVALMIFFGAGCASRAAAPAMTLDEYREDFGARQMLWMGDVAQRMEDYDLAVQVYQKVVNQYPKTRWAQQAQKEIAQVNADASVHQNLWDPVAGGTPAGEQSRRLLWAGDLAYKNGDKLLALKFYDRANSVSPNSTYGIKAACKSRWVRRWYNPGPETR